MEKREPKIIELPKFLDERGNLSFFENENQIPFSIRRVHWIYDVPGGENRGGVAYMTSEEFIIAMSGSFTVYVSDGEREWRISLNRSYMGVYIPAGLWRAIEDFSTNSVAVIAASTHYDPSDAIRSMDEYKHWITSNMSLNKQIEEHQVSVNRSKSDKPLTFQRYTVYDCGIIELDRHHSQRKGDICVVENGETVPFDVKRIYYLYDVPGGECRGSHGHKQLEQMIIAASGAFTITLDDGKAKRTFTLNRPYQGLLVKPGMWRTLDDFSSGSVCLVLASEKYEEADYIREYNDFVKYRKEQ